MEFQDVVRKRRMMRNYDDRPVPGGHLDQILQNALHAPSAGFSQGWAFLVLDSEEDRSRFWEAEWPDEERSGPHTAVMRAPVLIVPLSHKQAYLDRYAEPDKGWTDKDESRWPVPFWHIDTGFAAMLMMLTAVDLGLDTLFFGVRRIEEFRTAFDVPDGFTPIGALSLGYRAPDTPSPSLRRGRKQADTVVHRGRFGVPWGDGAR